MHQPDRLALRLLRLLVNVAPQVVFQFRGVLAVEPSRAARSSQIFRQPLLCLCRPVFHDEIVVRSSPVRFRSLPGRGGSAAGPVKSTLACNPRNPAASPQNTAPSPPPAPAPPPWPHNISAPAPRGIPPTASSPAPAAASAPTTDKSTPPPPPPRAPPPAPSPARSHTTPPPTSALRMHRSSTPLRI